jgi:hypothetical protein
MGRIDIRSTYGLLFQLASTIKNPSQSSTKHTSSSHQNVTCSGHDIAGKLFILP